MSGESARSFTSFSAAQTRTFSSFFFREPVDPVKLQIPHYFTVIPRKDARDLKLSKDKLDMDKYDTPEALEADVDLMVRNAVTFNGAESIVAVAAITLQGKFQDMIVGTKSQLRKRKERDKEPGVGSGQTKKARLS